jgi:hypothetical protein
MGNASYVLGFSETKSGAEIDRLAYHLHGLTHEEIAMGKRPKQDRRGSTYESVGNVAPTHTNWTKSILYTGIPAILFVEEGQLGTALG